LHRLSPKSVHIVSEDAPAAPQWSPRSAPQHRFWGKSEAIVVGKTAPAGWPKSDCQQNKADEYGASMAALSRSIDTGTLEKSI
jgi:hypothetical protein